jgi:hypothetical protein
MKEKAARASGYSMELGHLYRIKLFMKEFRFI